MQKLNFEGLAGELLLRVRDLLPIWLPGGRLQNREYVCGNLRGEPGRSLSVNLDTGKWGDFNTGDKGGDLISLYAAIEGISQGEAYYRLAGSIDYFCEESAPMASAREIVPVEVMPPPPDEPEPDMRKAHFQYCYRDENGNPIFYIARYEDKNGKRFMPFSWSVNGGWINKAWPEPRPLYGLHELKQNSTKQVLIVEGEKAADAAWQIVQNNMAVVSWAGGANAFKKTDWSVLYGRSVFLWPDNDDAGRRAMEGIAALLKEHCSLIKILNTIGTIA